MATSKKSATKKKTVAKKAAAKKTTAAKTATKKTVAKKAAAPKTAVKKTVAKKAPAKKAAATKPATKKAPVKAAATKKTVTKKAPAPKAAASKAASAKAVTKATPKRSSAARTSSPVGDSIEPYQETPGEDYMNDDQREHFRNILLAWKRELMEEVDRTVHHMQDEAANFPDPNDRATQESEFSMELRARDRERKLIKKIDETISKLDHDEYGYCESCGVEIGVRRLEARPTAALCIDCKTLDEIREKQMGG